MNERFLLLPEEKRQKIINAGYKVFSENSYKKSPVSEIAAAAGISKSLLFHYFHNKRDLYICLFEYAKEITHKELLNMGVMESEDFFEFLEKNLRAKCNLTRRYPYIGAFTLRVFYEQEPEIKNCLRHIFGNLYRDSKKLIQKAMERSDFRDEIDPELVYNEINWALYGYMHMVHMSEKVDANKIESDLLQMISFWKKIYLKDEEASHVI